MVEVKPNLEIWVSGYVNKLNDIRARLNVLAGYCETIQETIPSIAEELALIENGNKILMDYFNSEIKKEKENGKE